MTPHRTALFIIRAWVDNASSKPLRVHLRMTTDVSKGLERQVTVADASSTAAAVGRWLDDVLKDGGVQTTSTTTEDPTRVGEGAQRISSNARDMEHEGTTSPGSRPTDPRNPGSAGMPGANPGRDDAGQQQRGSQQQNQ